MIRVQIKFHSCTYVVIKVKCYFENIACRPREKNESVEYKLGLQCSGNGKPCNALSFLIFFLKYVKHDLLVPSLLTGHLFERPTTCRAHVFSHGPRTRKRDNKIKKKKKKLTSHQQPQNVVRFERIQQWCATSVPRHSGVPRKFHLSL
jgi:hypothetical protein